MNLYKKISFKNIMSKDIFNTAHNKGLLWNLLFEEGTFNGISKEHVHEVHNEFEKKITEVEKSALSSDSLVSLNKRILSEITNELQKFKKGPVTSSEISEQRQNQFDKNVNTKQKEFDSLITQSRPNDIEFGDKLDEPIGAEMDKMVAETLKRREQELNVVLQGQDTSEATQWINKNNKNNNHIKIGDNTDLEEKPVEILNKQVSFSDDTFLSQLKPRAPLPSQPSPPSKDSILDTLNLLNTRMDTFEQQQIKIISLLERK